MGTEVKLFNSHEFGQLRGLEKENKDKYTGFFYILEYGNFVKIGSTKSPHTRMQSLKRSAVNYNNSTIGRLALSAQHTNYVENEKVLHKHFSKFRKADSELFDLPFEDIVNNLPELEYKDETEEFERRADAFFEGMKRFMQGGATK